MKPKLENELFKKYPKMFSKPLEYGIETWDGWYWLIDKLCGCIQNYINNNPKHTTQVIIEQVKEKFGGLRFYYKGGDITLGTIRGMVWFVEDLSNATCEKCGSLEGEQHFNALTKTLCPKCAKQIKEKRIKKWK